MMLKIDQEFKNLIPPLTSEDRIGLENNIKANGCETPITVWDGTIIDGHNRYEICIANDIPFETKEILFADRNDAKIWIIMHELEWKGRKITPYIRASLALKMKDIMAEKAKANQEMAGELFGKGKEQLLQNSANPIEPIDTRKELAKLADVSHDTIHRVEVIQRNATSEIKKELEEGKKSINEAYIEVKRQEIQKQEEEARKQHKIEKEQEQDIKEPENRINPEWKELEKKCVNGSCTYNPASVLDVLSMCPCGCGYGFYSNLRTEKDKWYSKDEITKLKEMK